MEKQQVTYPNPVFAFWNIIKPTDMEAYDGPQPKNDNFEEAMKFKSDHWYDWNVRNWGTKWDVAVSSLETNPDTYMEDTVNGENYVVYYNFETAWSRPMGALTKLSEQYPDLLFTLSYEEETGWGGECELLRGKVISESQYDNMCRNCDGTYLDNEITGCDDCGDYPCPLCGWSNDMCNVHQTRYEDQHA
jgi:hypothetical protein